MFWRNDLQQVSLLAALVEAVPLPGLTNQLILEFFKLQVVHIEVPVNGTGVEQELVGGDRKQRAGQFPDPRLVEIFQILRRKEQGRLLLPHPLQAVADIRHRSGVGEPQI